MSEIETTKQVGRRTVLKGAAWSVPVVAAAVATPFASASVNQKLDVGVYGYCTGQYDIADLRTLLSGVSLLGLPVGFGLDQLVGIVQAALALTPLPNIQANAKRGFTITVKGDKLPAGSKFVLSTTPGSLITLGLQNTLLSLIAAQATFLVAINGSNLVLTTQTDVPAGGTLDVNLVEGLLDVDALTTTHLTFNPATDTTAPGEDPDTGQFTTVVGTPVNLGQLNLGSVLTSVLGPVLGAAVGLVLGTVLLPRLNSLNLRVQLCN